MGLNGTDSLTPFDQTGNFQRGNIGFLVQCGLRTVEVWEGSSGRLPQAINKIEDETARDLLFDSGGNSPKCGYDRWQYIVEPQGRSRGIGGRPTKATPEIQDRVC